MTLISEYKGTTFFRYMLIYLYVIQHIYIHIGKILRQIVIHVAEHIHGSCIFRQIAVPLQQP